MAQVTEDGVLVLREGDSESIDISMKTVSSGTTQTVNFVTGDRVTFTIRRTPSDTQPVLTVTELITSATQGEVFTLNIAKQSMATIASGDYSCDIQVDFADGKRKTIFPNLNLDALDTYMKNSKNWKNCRVVGQITRP